MCTLKPILLTAITLLPSLCLSTNQEVANEQANQHSLGIIANLPRYGGDSELGLDDFTDHQMTYFIGIGSLMAIPFALVALSLALCPFFFIFRCCKCCCCKLTKPKNKITQKEIYLRFGFVLLCTIVMVIMAGIAYAANIDFSGALLYNTGSGEEGNLFDVAEGLFADGVTQVDSLTVIIIAMKSSIEYVIDGVQSILLNTGVIVGGTGALTNMLYDISATWSNYTVTTSYLGDSYYFDCEFCSTISTTIYEIVSEIDADVGPIFSNLNNTVNSIGSTLVLAEADILAQIDDFVDQVTDVRNQMDDMRESVSDTRPHVVEFNDQRELAYNILFCIPLLPIIFIVFGGILKKAFCFTVSYICLWFSCTLMFLLLAIHLPIAVLLNDSCNFMTVIDEDVTGTINNTVGKVFESCLDNSRLITVLGLDGSLNFTNAIQFPTLGNITDDFTFGELLTFEDDADTTDFSTFYVSGNIAFSGINNITTSIAGPTDYYTRDNYTSLTPSSYPYPANDTLFLLKNIIIVEQLSITAFTDVLNKIRANLSSVSGFVSNLTVDVQVVVNEVNNASVLLTPLFNLVDDIIDEARCGFIGDAYTDTKGVMCSAVLGSLSRIVVAMFVVGILSILSCCCSLKLVRKVQWFQQQKAEEKELKLQQSFQPNKPSVIIMHSQPNNMGYQPGNNVPPTHSLYSQQI